jgi:tetratricopeptide (TPR) repeat protein
VLGGWLRTAGAVLALPVRAFWRSVTFLSSKEGAVAATLLVVVALCALEWRSTSAIIGNFEVAPEVAKTGLSSDVIANMLQSELRTIHRISGTSMRIAELSTDRPLAYAVPGTGLSVTSVVGELRRRLGGRQLRVSGSVLQVGPEIESVLIIEQTGDDAFKHVLRIDRAALAACRSVKFKTHQADRTDLVLALNRQMSCAAELVLKHTQPYILAAYLGEIGAADEAFDLLRLIVVRDRSRESYWALNLMGSMRSAEASSQRTDQAGQEQRRREALDFFARSEAEFAKAKEGDSTLRFALTYYNRAHLYADAGEFAKAEAEYDKATKEDPGYVPIYTSRGNLRAWQARGAKDREEQYWREAEEFYQRGLEVAKPVGGRQLASVWRNWAWALLLRTEDDDARRANVKRGLNLVAQALAVDPADGDLYFLKGRLHASNPDQNDQLALEAFATAAALKPWKTEFLERYAKALRRMKKYDDSIVQLKIILEREPSNLWMRIEHADTLSDSIETTPANFTTALKVYYEAYDLAIARSNQAAREHIGKNVLAAITRRVATDYEKARTLQRSAGGVPSMPPAMSNEAKSAFEAVMQVFVDEADILLGRRHFELADRLNRAILQRTHALAGQAAADELRVKFVKKLVAASSGEIIERRQAVVEMALDYLPDDDDLLVRRFLISHVRNDLQDADRFATHHCWKSKALLEVATERMPGWKCPQ